MNDISRIEDFLEKMKCLAKDREITERHVYANLTNLGVPDGVLGRVNISGLFDGWQEKFKNNDSIKVFVRPDWKYFCQFTNMPNGHLNAYNMIKMYIPLDKEHINEGVNKLFTFMADNKIEHMSKVGSHIRFDDVVVRVNDFETAKKIHDYVLSDPYLKEGLLPPSPFAFNDGNIAYAWDGRISFNDTVSKYITNYINLQKRNNKLDNVSYKGFLEYVKSIYNTVFNDKKNISDYINLMGISTNKEGYEIKHEVENYGKVTELMLASLLPNKKMSDFVNIVGGIINSYNTDSKKVERELENLRRIREKELSMAAMHPNKKTSVNAGGNINSSDNSSNEVKNASLFNQIYDALVKKYGNREDVGKIIFNYLKTGNVKYFTRNRDTNGINVRELIVKNQLDPGRFFQMIITDEKRKKQSDALLKAVIATVNKYGYDQAMTALKNSQEEGFFRNFTNDNDVRAELMKCVSKGEIFELMREHLLLNGYSINDIDYDFDKLCSQYFDSIEIDKSLHKAAR